MVGEAEWGGDGGGAERPTVLGVGKGQSDVEGTLTRQEAIAAVGAPLGCERGASCWTPARGLI